MEPERGAVWPFRKVAAWWCGPCCVSTGAAVLSQPKHMELLQRGDSVDDAVHASVPYCLLHMRKMARDDWAGWPACSGQA